MIHADHRNGHCAVTMIDCQSNLNAANGELLADVIPHKQASGYSRCHKQMRSICG